MADLQSAAAIPQV